jgi:hypothetical protein
MTTGMIDEGMLEEPPDLVFVPKAVELEVSHGWFALEIWGWYIVGQEPDRAGRRHIGRDQRWFLVCEEVKVVSTSERDRRPLPDARLRKPVAT